MARISDCEELDVAGDRIGIRPETRRPASVRDEVATYDAAPVAPTTEMESDPIRDLLRAKGYLEDEHRPRPDPQGKDEPYVDYVERVSKWIMRGRVFSEDSVELLRQLRDERDAQLDRVAGSETAEG